MQKAKTPTKSVLITFEGDTTRATLLTDYTGDTRAKTAFAKRNPADPYHPYEGARVALARLFGLEPFPEDPEPKFDEGDLVRITVTDPYRNLHEQALGKVMRKAPNKMVPYAVKILDDDRFNNPLLTGFMGFKPFETVVLPGEMKKVIEDGDEE